VQSLGMVSEEFQDHVLPLSFGDAAGMQENRASCVPSETPKM